MSDELNNGALRLAVAQICQSMGWDALQKSTHDLLTDVLQRYMQEIGKCAYDYSQLYCHTEPNLEDLGLAFNDTGVLVHELEDFVTQVDQVPFSYQLPRFPMPKPNVLHHPHKEEIVDRPEFYHEHLPPLIKALQQTEDEGERDAAEIQGLEDSSDSTKSFLRSEIKTVGQETQNQLTENGADKRTTNSSVEFETEAKRRRLESPFNKQNKENKLDMLQVLQEKNSQSQSPSPSPDFVPIIDPDDKKHENTVFTFRSMPPIPSSPKTVTTTKKKASKKNESPSKDKLLLASPEVQGKKQSQGTSGATNSPKKTPAKSKSKPKPTASPVKEKNVSPKKTPLKPSPKKKSKPQEKSQKAAAAKSGDLSTSPASKKKSKPVEKEEKPFSPPLPLPVLHIPHKEDTTNTRIITQTMPKLIIKPLKHEKNQLSEYSVSEIPLETSTLDLGKKKGVKRKATTAKDTLGENEPKPKKKKKKKVSVAMIDNTALESQPLGGFPVAPGSGLPCSFPTVSVSSTQMLSEVQSAKKVGDTIKKKKKKHKEKDRDKTKQKKVKETTSEFSISSSSAMPIPTIKLKLENPSSTSTISTDAGTKLSEITASKKSHSLPFPSVPSQPIDPQPLPHVIKQGTFDDTVPTSSAATGQILLTKTKEGVPRTVITETLSTTVQIYYCPACGLADDGSFMIGCDSCDSWYHGACVGINDDPGGDWYCEVCTAKKAKKKKKKKSKDKDKHN